MVTVDDDGAPTDATVQVEILARALRRIRPSVYQISREADQTTITLTVEASAAGRRNAATRIVTALAGGGIVVVAADPIGELARGASLALTHRPR